MAVATTPRAQNRKLQRSAYATRADRDGMFRLRTTIPSFEYIAAARGDLRADDDLTAARTGTMSVR